MTADPVVDPSAVCMPCWLADKPPVADTPHGCPGAVIIGHGAEVKTKLCGCLVCWPDGPLPPRSSLT